MSDDDVRATERLVALAGVSAQLAAVGGPQLDRAVADGLDDLLLHLAADRWTLVRPQGREPLGGPLSPLVIAGVEEALSSSDPVVVIDDRGPLAAALAAAGTTSAVAVAVSAATRPLGVLLIERRSGDAWDPASIGLVRAVADILAAALVRRLAEDDARRAEDRYRRLLATSAEGVCLLDAVGVIRDANPAFGALVAGRAADVIGTPIVDYLLPSEAPVVATRLLHTTGRSELELLGTDGRRRWVSCVTSALRDDADAGALALVMLTDISHRRAAEAALRNSEARFRALVRSSPDVIVVTDDTGTIAFASPAVADVLGHDPAVLTGASPLELVHPGDLLDVEARSRALWEARTGSIVVRCRIAKADGAYLPMEATLTNLIDDEAVAGVQITARDISAELEAHARLTHDATHDAVTGLANRRVFDGRLRDALRTGPMPVAVLFADLDGFKGVNDALGHDVGDELLRGVGERLRGAVRDGDLVVRHGGDEFAILCPGVSGLDEAMLVAQRIVSSVSSEVFAVGGTEVGVGVSVGVALSPSVDRMPARRLVAAADAAMYAAKASGDGCAHAPIPA